MRLRGTSPITERGDLTRKRVSRCSGWKGTVAYFLVMLRPQPKHLSTVGRHGDVDLGEIVPSAQDDVYARNQIKQLCVAGATKTASGCWDAVFISGWLRSPFRAFSRSLNVRGKRLACFSQSN